MRGEKWRTCVRFIEILDTIRHDDVAIRTRMSFGKAAAGLYFVGKRRRPRSFFEGNAFRSRVAVHARRCFPT